MEEAQNKPLDRLASLLSIKIEDWMQDWDIECADPTRVEEFCEIYERENLDDFEKAELLRLIIASYDEVLETSEQLNLSWQYIRRILENDFHLHKDVIEYWSLLEETDAENVFPITPLMREFWHQHIAEK